MSHLFLDKVATKQTKKSHLIIILHPKASTFQGQSCTEVPSYAINAINANSDASHECCYYANIQR